MLIYNPPIFGLIFIVLLGNQLDYTVSWQILGCETSTILSSSFRFFQNKDVQFINLLWFFSPNDPIIKTQHACKQSSHSRYFIPWQYHLGTMSACPVQGSIWHSDTQFAFLVEHQFGFSTVQYSRYRIFHITTANLSCKTWVLEWPCYLQLTCAMLDLSDLAYRP